MIGNLKILQTFSAMAGHAAQKHEVIARNIANANTPGYKARDIQSFEELYAASEREGTDPRLVRSAERLMTVSQGTAPNGNNVSIEEQMLGAAEAKGQHDMALAIYRKTLDLVRLSIGRNN